MAMALTLALSIDHAKIFNVHAWLILPCYHLVRVQILVFQRALVTPVYAFRALISFLSSWIRTLPILL